MPEEKNPKPEDRKSGNQGMAGGLGIGLVIGIAIGTAMDNIGMGVALGLALGVALGSSGGFGLTKKKQGTADEDKDAR